mmetsp:Transcript_34236/g.51104  ORF Transcript_34236/g.51104 Transcript_34236/m.51104 type:complete len:85 (-) Transcript_34236:243-497(-)
MITFHTGFLSWCVNSKLQTDLILSRHQLQSQNITQACNWNAFECNHGISYSSFSSSFSSSSDFSRLRRNEFQTPVPRTSSVIPN